MKLAVGFLVIALFIWLGFYNWQLSVWLMCFLTMANSSSAAVNTKILGSWK